MIVTGKEEVTGMREREGGRWDWNGGCGWVGGLARAGGGAWRREGEVWVGGMGYWTAVERLNLQTCRAGSS